MTDWREARVPSESLSSCHSFVEQFGGIYEHSPWVAKEAWVGLTEQPSTTFGALALAMARSVASAAEDAKLQLLRSHPELASKAALAGELTEASNREQSGAGLDRCSPAELAQIQELNAEYGARFGFPFIIAVSGLNRSDIISAMAKRILNSRDEELAEALLQVDRIAQVRLAALAGIQQESNA